MTRNTTIDEERWFTTTEAAARVGYTTSWVRDQIKQERLKAQVHVRDRRASIRIRESDLEHFIRFWLS